MKVYAKGMLALWLVIAGSARATTSEDALAVYGHYLGCLDGVASSRISSGEADEAALTTAEHLCAAQFDVVANSIRRVFRDNLSAEEYAAGEQQIDMEVEKLIAFDREQARKDVRKLISQRRDSEESLKALQDSADAASRAAEAAVPSH